MRSMSIIAAAALSITALAFSAPAAPMTRHEPLWEAPQRRKGGESRHRKRLRLWLTQQTKHH